MERDTDLWYTRHDEAGGDANNTACHRGRGAALGRSQLRIADCGLKKIVTTFHDLCC
jgi:hypothetical protein